MTTNLAIDQTLQQAVKLHQAGHLQDAERLYRAILQAQPDHSDANHNMGVLAVQMKQPSAGLSFFKRAVEANQNQGQYWLSYIDALLRSGQTDAARQALSQGKQRGLQGDAVKALAKRLGGGVRVATQSNTEYPPFINGKDPSQHEINALVALVTAGRYKEAATLAQTMTQRYPQHGFGWMVLGAMHKQMGRGAEALEMMQKAVALSPGNAEAHSNLGVTLQEMGRLDEAEAFCRRALQIKPDYAEAHYNLGITLKYLGRLGEAEASYRQALEIKPDFVETHFNLGVVFHDSGRPDEAEASYRRALEINPYYADALENLALLFAEQGKWIMGFNTIKQSLRIKETAKAKGIFVACVKRLRFAHDDSELRTTLVRALIEPWGRPSDLSKVCIELVKFNPDIGGGVTRAADAWPVRLSAQDLFGSGSLAAVAEDSLVLALLDSAPICDIGMEHFLTMTRRIMLKAAAEMAASSEEASAILNFCCALARQCFINEYVFACTDDEIHEAAELRDSLVAALEARTQVPAFWVVAVAAYVPLYSLPYAVRLLDIRWPEAVAAVLKQQISEPEEELQLRASTPRLAVIEDEVSLLVQRQYEENPYPRWVKAAPAGNAKNIVGYLTQKFPLAPINFNGQSDNVDLLIAGCGTGQHSIDTARQFQGARVLAVDLSISSLGYAKRKTRELGLTSIEYAQADLLKLGALGRSFDVIESVGVLHHLVDPWAGWQVLLSLLRPGGFMKLGFYSEVARRNIVLTRAFIAEQGYGSSANEIRRCRQDLIDLGKENADFGNTIKSSDFFSTSACRDLLFHVQEYRMTLTGIDNFLKENNLTFLGFEIDPAVLRAYRLRFPDDRAAASLGQWQIFEHENPDTFFGMYQFWIQK